MNFISKSIIRRLFLHLLLFVVAVFAISYFFYFKSSGHIPSYFLFIGLTVFLLFFVFLYWWDIVRPLKAIMAQIQLLLTGKPYKRIFTTRLDEIGVLSYFFNKVIQGLGEASYDIKEKDRLVSDLSIASQLQQDILPAENPEVNGIQIIAKTKPATELGGDSFNFFKVGNKFYFYVGDVTGHGVAAGFIMTMVNSLIGVFTELYNSAYDIVVTVNKHIKKHVKKAMFMTLVMLCWDEERQALSYVGAGHEHILVYRAISGECEDILTGGVALGMVADNSKLVKEKFIDLNPGDFVVLYSDGITEARNAMGELFGLENLKKAVIEYAPQYSAEGVHYHIAKQVSDFMHDQEQSDDMTLIVIQRNENIHSGKLHDKTTNWK